MNGKKTWVANGPTADLFIVFSNLISRGIKTRTADVTMAPQPRLTAFLVERGMPGVTVHSDQVDKKAGLKGLETCPVTFKDVTLTQSHMIGEEGKGSDVLYKTLSSDRIVSNFNSIMIKEPNIYCNIHPWYSRKQLIIQIS